MKELVALAGKDLRLLYRNRPALFFTTVWPLAVALLFGAIFSGPDEGAGTIRVAIVDEDGTPASRTFGEGLSKADGLETRTASRSDAATLVRRGRLQAYILIPEGFGQRARQTFYGPTPQVELGIDPSRKAESAMLEGILMQQAAKGMQERLNDPAQSRQMADDALVELRNSPERGPAHQQTVRFLSELKAFLATDAASTANPGPDGTGARGGMNWQPIAVASRPIEQERAGPANAFAYTLPQGAVWALVGCAAAFAIGFVAERTRGTLVRLQLAPLTRAHLLAGKALACFVTAATVVSAVFVVGAVFLQVRPGSVPLLIVAIVCASSAFVGIMMVLAVLGRTEQAVGGSSWAALLLMSMMGGGMVPLFVMPGWMQGISDFSPVKWAILALEGAIWRGFSPAEMVLPCSILLAVGAVCFAIGARTFRTV
jgi:ABC-2 type transport system permease protein